ncbi:MAG: hypothetical protein ATN32_07315 [Candidatus Epulonipiscium fishelsonii]|nr:MAG: hypothetical protein ATN32_07315 [Epulopiscium sp. AS2M-Bin002]
MEIIYDADTVFLKGKLLHPVCAQLHKLTDTNQTGRNLRRENGQSQITCSMYLNAQENIEHTIKITLHI